MDGNPTVLIQAANGRWLRYSTPISILSTRQVSDVVPLLEAVAGAVKQGHHAAGFVSYEAAAAMDAALVTHPPLPNFPLIWFGIFPAPAPYELPEAARPPALLIQPGIARPRYMQAFEKIRAHLRNGDSYQVNYTFPLEIPFQGNAFEHFLALSHAQRGNCGAFVRFDGHAICSASPELFFELDADGLIRARPMKGTAPRGLSAAEDRELIRSLHNSEKARAENIMIVDMLRNDLGRIATPGSVAVTRRFDVERYPTVLQMTSTVEGRTEAGIVDIFKALFPCASVTGAPKVQTMRIIRDNEPHARGIYTGAIGCLSPDGAARFTVAIRTLHVDQALGVARYGVGSGIVWDSMADAEYDECIAKARILNAPPRPTFSLLETLLWEPEHGIFLLDRHLQRLCGSAEYFSIPLDVGHIRNLLKQATESSATTSRRVRLRVDPSGTARVDSTPLAAATSGQVTRLRLGATPTDPSNLSLYHKTTHRPHYDEARTTLEPNEDLLFLNTQGHVTESTIANLVVSLDGKRWTPPIADGLLPGTFREELLARGEIAERSLTPADLARADAIWLINSVRRWMPATLA